MVCLGEEDRRKGRGGGGGDIRREYLPQPLEVGAICVLHLLSE
jgi:hypothetical protein